LQDSLHANHPPPTTGSYFITINDLVIRARRAQRYGRTRKVNASWSDDGIVFMTIGSNISSIRPIRTGVLKSRRSVF